MTIQSSAAASGEPIDHHYLPIFYQAAWADGAGRVTRYSRPRDKVVAKSCSPRRTGSQDHLYTHFGVPPERAADLETVFFAPVDSEGAVAHQRLLTGGVAALSPDQRVNWARFMMSTQLRSPFSLGELWRLADHNLRNNMDLSDPEYDAVRSAEDPQTLYAWLEARHPEIIENIHKTWLPAMIDDPDRGTYLINMDWSVIDVASAKRRLLTGDRPLTHTHGWKHPDTTVLFPLSPTLLFAATNGKRQTGRLLQRTPAFLARNANEQLTRCAVDFVIGQDASMIEFVERNLLKVGAEPVPGPIGKGSPIVRHSLRALMGVPRPRAGSGSSRLRLPEPLTGLRPFG